MNAVIDDTRWEKLQKLAEIENVSVDVILQRAVDVYLEDREDAAAAAAVLERIERGEEATVSLDEVERRLGLDS